MSARQVTPDRLSGRSLYKESFFPPGILNIGRYVTHVALPNQSIHRHEEGLELLYVRKGSLRILLEGVPYTVSRGTILVVRPGEKHGGAQKIIHPGDSYWILLDLNLCRRNFGGDFAVVADALEKIEWRNFRVGPTVGALFHGLFEECAVAPDRFSEATLAALSKTLLTRLAREYDRFLEANRKNVTFGERATRKAMAWIDANIAENWTVDKVAAIAGMKKSRFYELFVARAGFAPIDYRNRIRVERAKDMLRQTDKSVTEIAFALGFCSSQYFHLVFKTLEGVTPSEFRRGHAEAATRP